MIRRQPPKARLLQDACRLIFFSTIVTAIVAVVLFLPIVHPPVLDFFGRVVGALTTQLIAIGVLREIVPKPLVGAHRVGADKGYVRWLVNSAFTDIVNHPVIRWPFSFFDITRHIYFRVQGGRISFDASVPSSVRVGDPGLLSIERGAQLEAGVTIESALHATGRIRIDAVFIGGGCLIGAHALLMPGASFGEDARVGPGAYIGPDVSVGLGAKIGERAVIAAGVDVGSHTRIGVGAVVAEGVTIGDHAKIRPGSFVPSNSRVRDGEVWQGIPARPINRDDRSSSRTV